MRKKSGLLLAVLAFAFGLFAPRLIEAAAQAPFLVVDGDGWLTSNARHDSGGWTPFNGARPSFGLQLSARNDIPFDQGTAGATVWVRQPGCPRFAGFGERCGWQLGLAVTQFRSLVVGGHGIEIDGLTGDRPYGRIVNASDGKSRLVGVLTNGFADFSGVDKAGSPSWFAGVDVDGDTFSVRRSEQSPRSMGELFDVDRHGDARAAGSFAATKALQRAPAQWATRTRLMNGVSTFRFAEPFHNVPVCVATSEGTSRLHVLPATDGCTVTSENAADDTMVDIVAIGNPS